ncbi:D-amino-acid transaminase [Azospirillum griseum]|uniref:Probable branched-chain-amino-acid aminotransferase n=1 Tax=Azospirillum griseum TaxID=2496639 RepID=A0A431V9Q4_9PROT|nr:D-amino-acid transaminase [Azospirillum griseum]RTR12237.1 D-amino-acid transaminase [Azospirillum griseum]
MTQIAYVNGSFVPLAEAKISILDRGFLFGDGTYEVAAVLNGRIIDSSSHLARLQRSAEKISLALPETPDRLVALLKELIALNGLEEGFVYLQVTRGAAERDFAFPKDARPTLVMFVRSKKMIDSREALEGISVKTVPDIRWARRDIKNISLLAQVLSRQLAVDADCQEALMVENGFVTEGVSSSAFIVTADGVLVTRPRFNAILDGCTRKALIKLCEERKIPVEERLFSVAEALAAKEVFITSASVLVQGVVVIDGHPIGDGKVGGVVRRLREIHLEFAHATGV